MRAAVIKKDKVINIITVPDDFEDNQWGGETVVVSDTASIGDGYNNKEFTKPKTEPTVVTVIDIKNEASRRILRRLPEWKQNNYQSRWLELTAIEDGKHPLIEQRPLTHGELMERQVITISWSWVKEVRSVSDVLETSLPDNYKDDQHWPAWPG